MTRKSLNRTIARLYIFLGTILAISLVAKFADHMPFLKAMGVEGTLKDTYEFLRDMSLLIATGGVAYVSNVYQKRSSFVSSLETEWRGIVSTKNALYAFCEKPYPTPDDYIDAFCRISETLDNMRIVYRNVGETDTLIGLYPYAPLHDMRRALQTLDPRDPASITVDRKLARDTMLRSFYALREHFLEELDIEEPDSPILLSGARRLKMTGATGAAKSAQSAQQQRQSKAAGADDASDHLLRHLYEREQSKLQTGNGRSEMPTPSGN